MESDDLIIPTREEVRRKWAKPRSLFKYCGITTNSTKSLKTRKWWFASPSTFNDPFDTKIIWPSMEEQDSIVQTLSRNGPMRIGPPRQRKWGKPRLSEGVLGDCEWRIESVQIGKKLSIAAAFLRERGKEPIGAFKRR